MADQPQQPKFEPPTTPSPSTFEYIEKSDNTKYETR